MMVPASERLPASTEFDVADSRVSVSVAASDTEVLGNLLVSEMLHHGFSDIMNNFAGNDLTNHNATRRRSEKR